MRFILWSLLAAYFALVNSWPAAASLPEAIASGGLTVVLQPSVLAAVGLGALVVHYLRRPAHAPARRH